ncbi:hypothetical protein [Rhodococcoides yunnanense]|uniref:hypothetical protein n=1 Tax=Rhodococcoides yunnanense TaxID=278209 RepID=UPI000934C71A|nr:hypothetical protein [Rhodococcus yunnanensis]
MAGDRWDRALDENSPGVRRINYAFVDQYSPEYAAMEADAAQRGSAERERKAKRRDVPGSRKPPPDPTGLRSRRADELEFPLDATRTDTMRLFIGGLEIHRTGLLFSLIAREDGSAVPSFIGERVNLTHRIRPPHRHRIYLGVVLPDGQVVTNTKSTPALAPEDDDLDTPWLYGGTSYSTKCETGASYFLSPLPSSTGRLTVTIAYPE